MANALLQNPSMDDGLLSGHDLIHRQPRKDREADGLFLTDRPRRFRFAREENRLIIEFRTDPQPWEPQLLDAVRSLISLPPNWDSYAASPVDFGALTRSLDVLLRLLRPQSLFPSVVPTSAGGVQFEWHANNIDLELTFDPGHQGDVYYEDVTSGDTWYGDISDHMAAISQMMDRLAL